MSKEVKASGGRFRANSVIRRMGSCQISQNLVEQWRLYIISSK